MLISYQAFELAWANTHVYGKCRPFIVHSDDIWFRKPVEVGSMLYFNSQISYTEDNYVQTRVSAEVKGIASLLPESVDAIAICTLPVLTCQARVFISYFNISSGNFMINWLFILRQCKFFGNIAFSWKEATCTKNAYKMRVL